MALLSYAAINSGLQSPGYPFTTQFNPVVSGLITVCFAAGETTRASNNAACDRNTPDSIFEYCDKPNTVGEEFYILGLDLWPYDRRAINPGTIVNTQLGAVELIDRLVATRGLSANTGSAQTTNLPTAALSRNTDGEGVVLALEVYTNDIGVTARTVTASYTNQSGTSGRTSIQTGIGGDTDGRRKHLFIRLPLQQGDTGVRSVQSITLSGGTGTIGDLGVVLYHPLLMVPELNFLNEGKPSFKYRYRSATNGAGRIPKVSRDACFQMIASLSFNQVCGLNGMMYIKDAS